MSQNDYILFYSSQCVHSKEFLVLLEKDPELNRKFIKINIDNRGTKIPHYVKSVPSAIIPHNGKSGLLVGNSIFKWYDDNHKQNIESNDILDYDPMGMAGYSDSFSFLQSDGPLKKAYTFINENFGGVSNVQQQQNLEDSQRQQQRVSQKSKELSTAYDNLMNARKYDIPQPISRLGGS